MTSKTLRNICAAVAVTMLPANALAQAGTIYGYSRTGGATGLVTIPTQSTATATLTSGDVMCTAGAVKDKTMYISAFNDDFDMLFYKVDLADGSTQQISQLPESTGTPTDMGYNYNDEQMYFVTNSYNEYESTSMLCTINLESGRTTIVKSDLGFYARCMTVSTDGTMYYMTRDGVLCTYDIATGKKQTIGDSGISPREGFCSLGFDHSANKLYWSVQKKGEYVNHLYE